MTKAVIEVLNNYKPQEILTLDEHIRNSKKIRFYGEYNKSVKVVCIHGDTPDSNLVINIDDQEITVPKNQLENILINNNFSLKVTHC